MTEQYINTVVLATQIFISFWWLILWKVSFSTASPNDLFLHWKYLIFIRKSFNDVSFQNNILCNRLQISREWKCTCRVVILVSVTHFFFRIQSILSIVDMLYSGYLVITDGFSWHLPNCGQTLIRKPLCTAYFYEKHLL